MMISTSPTSLSSSSSSLLRTLAVAIALVLALHWYLVLQIANNSYGAPHGTGHPFLESPSTRAKTTNQYKQISNRNNNSSIGEPEKPYILSSQCGGCYRAYRGNEACSDVIQLERSRITMTLNQTLTHEEGLHFVGRTISECAICSPVTCYKHYGGVGDIISEDVKYKYWRFDQAAPKYNHATSLMLPSIPQHLRIPPSKYNDMESYARQLYNDPDPKNMSNAYLVEYNPSLAVLPASMKANLPQDAVYVASFRVTPKNYCFTQKLELDLGQDIAQTMHGHGNFGIALLDSNYQIIPGYDAVIDLDVQLGVKRLQFKGEPSFSDYRFFVLNDELYLHVYSDTVLVTQIQLRAKGFGIDEEVHNETTNEIPSDIHYNVLLLGDNQYKLKNLLGGDKLEVTLMHQFNSIWGRVDEKRLKEEKKRWLNFEKNFALFALPNGNIYTEIAIWPEHIVRQIDPNDYEPLPKSKLIKTRERRNFRVDEMVQRRIKTINETTSTRSPQPSFFTVDEHWFPGKQNPFKEFAHGGACCVPFSLDDFSDYPHDVWDGIDSVMVGVAHNTITGFASRRIGRDLVAEQSYVSFFYAFDSRPPFDLLARSGYFCLGHASPSDSGSINPLNALTGNLPLVQHNETFRCPLIHFVQTFVEKANDQSSTVIGYGINDCTARLVEVSKKEIARLLFSQELALEQ